MMKANSLIFLNKYFFQHLNEWSSWYICDDDMENTLNVYNLISRWDCFSKHNETLFDRTNTICGPLRITNISPIPEFDINFNKSLI